MRGVLAVLCVVGVGPLGAGCRMLPISGYAVEGFVGLSQLAPEPETAGAADDNEGLGLSVGVSLAIEVDFVRSSDLGAGMAFVGTKLPEDDMGEVPLSLGWASQYWFASALPYGTDWLRLRGHMGLLFGQGSSGLIQAYLGGGASLHPAQGTAVHLFVGPHWLAVRSPSDGTTFTGLGLFARLRLRRSFFPRCDVPPPAGGLPREICPGGGR